MATSSVQYRRVCQVVVGSGGSGLLVENLRMEFEITKTVQATPNTCNIKIYNLNTDHEQQIKNEFDEVIVNAGYRDSVRLIFRGSIKSVYHYRKGTDHITEIEAGDGDKDYRGAMMNETLAAGTSVSQLLDRAIASFTGGTIRGNLVVPNTARIRGKVCSGNTRRFLSEVARGAGANWSIQDGRLDIVSTSSVLPTEAIVVNATTGMLAAPEVSDKGISVKCLLNPQFQINGAILLDNNDLKLKIVRAPKGSSTSGKRNTKAKGPIPLNPDGVYKIIRLDHKGDTRSNDWTTSLITIGLGQPIPSDPAAVDSAPEIDGEDV